MGPLSPSTVILTRVIQCGFTCKPSLSLVAWLVLGPLIVQGPKHKQDSRDDPLAPDRVHGIQGVSGFKTVSIVEFEGLPEAPHEWTTIYAYPDRARWSLRPTTGASTSPMLVYRFGAHTWTIQAGSTVSAESSASGPRTTLIQMELRRALTIWPLGFQWAPTSPGERRAPIFALQHKQEEAPIGYMLASLDKTGNLLGMQAFESDATPVEELRILAWREFEDRSWPAEIMLLKEDQPIWKETLTYASARGYHNDLLFTPPDRRSAGSANTAKRLQIQHIDLPQVTLMLKPVEPGISWPEALEMARRAIQGEQGRLDAQDLSMPRLDTVPAFQLDAAGRPTQAIMRFRSPIHPPPMGWTTLETRPAVAVVVGAVQAIDGDLILVLRAALPPAADLGAAYCRVLSQGAKVHVQLYQPIDND